MKTVKTLILLAVAVVTTAVTVSIVRQTRIMIQAPVE
jgi:hypothetical protein